MTGIWPFRSLQSVMVVTLHVAVVAYVLRSFVGTGGPEGSVAVWAPLSVFLALFLSLPIGHAVAAAFRPGDGLADRTCPRCGRHEVRPLLRAGAGLFPPVVGARCAACKTTFRPDGDLVIEEPATPAVADPEGIRFEEPGGAEPEGVPEIRFLDDANIPIRPVSEA